jgi:apolipoprotein N-acyltransferase
MRTPLVIAANRGLTAYVDYLGRVASVTERNRPDALVVDVETSPWKRKYPSFYAKTGDWLAGSCVVFCAALAFIGRPRRARST